MASDIWLRTILIVREETRCRHIGYSYRLTARVLLYAPSHRQDNTYHGLCYTSRGALAGTRNSLMGPPHEGSIRWPIAPWANALPLSYVPLPHVKHALEYPRRQSNMPNRFLRQTYNLFSCQKGMHLIYSGEGERCDCIKFVHASLYRSYLTYPDPLPPTIATFFPDGTVKVNPLRILWPGTYSKYTSLKVMIDSCGETLSTGAFGFAWKHNLCLVLTEIQFILALTIKGSLVK